MSTLLFKFVFLDNSSPSEVLTSTELTGGDAPTINISTTAIADGTVASLVSGGALTYDSFTKSWGYRLASADLESYLYIGMAATTYSTASPAEVHALGMVVPDELISTRLATGADGDTGETLSDQIDALDVVPAASVTAVLDGSVVTILRGDTLSLSITGLGNISTRSKLWFTVKASDSSQDSAADIQIEESTGLVYINGAEGTPANGSITVDDAAAGDITIALAAAAADDLVPQRNLSYDVQQLTAAGVVETLTSGTAHITGDITRRITQP